MKTLRYLFPAMAWIILVTILSLVSTKEFDKTIINQISGIDILVHIAMYAVMSLLTLWGFSKIAEVQNRQLVWILLICSVIGVVLELLQQTITTTRHFDIYDIIANIVGASLGSFIYFIKKPKN